MSKKTTEFTRDELFLWCCERLLESLMNGRFREGVSMVMDQVSVWAAKQTKTSEFDRTIIIEGIQRHLYAYGPPGSDARWNAVRLELFRFDHPFGKDESRKIDVERYPYEKLTDTVLVSVFANVVSCYTRQR